MDPNDEHNPSDSNGAKSPNGSANGGPANGGSANGANGSTPARRPGMVGAPMHGQQPVHSAVVHSADGLVQILGRRWAIIAAITVLTLFGGLMYVVTAKKIYKSEAKLRVEPMDAESITATNGNNNSNNSQDPAVFLQTQCTEIKSAAVLSLALDKIRNTKTLAGNPRPLDYLDANLTAEPAKQGAIIELSLEGPYSEEVGPILDAVIDAYKTFEKNAYGTHVNDILQILSAGSDARIAKITAEQKRQAELAKELDFMPNVDSSKNPDQMQVTDLTTAKLKVDAELRDARTAYDSAGQALVGKPDLIKKFDEAQDQKGTSFTGTAENIRLLQSRLEFSQAKLDSEIRDGYGASHPRVQADTKNVEDLTVDIAIAAKQWVEDRQNSLDSINSRLAEAQQKVRDHQNDVNEYLALSNDVNRLTLVRGDVEQRLSNLNLTKGSGALNIRDLQDAMLSAKHRPVKSTTLAIAGVMGLILGIAVACVVDWADDRVRTTQDIQTAASAPVLGSIPEIAGGTSSSDRAQIVHHDPFGEAAESYRTLATAIQFGLPPRTKTILVTSAVSGDGKSTLVSNLGISLAQAGKRVLIVDADFRAPMQHRLFDLKDRSGLSTVLAGGERVERAIQRTEIEGLDVLGCGPVPANPSEVLNDPAFVEYLNELADKYDLVLIDSPPVTAVADARILAVSADVSMLVVRPARSTRKQVTAARDGLRSVGARLVGVAVNGISKRSGFTSASGYYPRTGPLAGPARRRTPMNSPESV